MKKFHIDFYAHRRVYFGISIGLFLLGIIFNFVFGTQLDTNFKGGAMLRYSYAGEINPNTIEDSVQQAINRDVTVTINRNVKSADGSQTLNNVTLALAGDDSLSLENQKTLTATLTKLYPKANFNLVTSDSVNPTMGRSFFLKCIVAILIAFLLLDFYIALRFRKIGGAAAGFFAIVALLHDVAIVYFTFIIFRIPLNDSFIAVVLTILGYSLNDTIVIYDRIRENRRLMGLKTGFSVLVNASINQTLTRSVYTALCTFISVATVYVVGVIYNLSSVTTFALPMMMGVISGCYSTVCIAGPLYVMWENRKSRLRAQTAAIAAPARTPAVPAGSDGSAPVSASAKGSGKKVKTKAKAKKRKR